MKHNINTWLATGAIIFIVILCYYLIKREDTEDFSSNTTLESRSIDFVSVIPEPINNPTKLVVVIGYEQYLWKYDIIPKNITNMSEFEVNSLGLKLITGYPKLISEEWSHLPNNFNSDLTGVFNPYRWFWVVKNSQWTSKSNYTNDKESGTLTSTSWFTNLTKIMDPNTIDTYHSHPDMAFGSGNRNNYLTNEYPNYSKINTTPNTKNYVYNNVYTTTKQYQMTLPSDDWTKLSSNIWTEYNKSPLTRYTHVFNHLALQPNSVDSFVYLNDLQTCLIRIGNTNRTVTDCALWYQIKNKIRAVCVVKGFVYVLSRNRVWKYTPTGNNLLLESGYPCKFNEEWTNLDVSDNISAMIAYDSQLFIFKDDTMITYDIVTDSLIAKTPIKTILPDVTRIDTVYQNNDLVTFYCDDMSYTYNMTGSSAKLINKTNLTTFFVAKYNHPISKNPVTIYKDYTDINKTKINNSDLYHVCAKTLFVSNDVSEIVMYQQSNNSNGLLSNVAFDGNMITGLNSGSGLHKIMQSINIDNINDISGILSIKNIIYIFQDNKVHLYKSADGSFVSTYNISAIWKSSNMEIPARCNFMFYDHSKYVWFFKNGIVYKMDIDTMTIESGKYSQYFDELNECTESVFYHKESDIMVFVQGITYSYYKYNSGQPELIDIDLMMDTLIINTIKNNKFLIFNVNSQSMDAISQKRMVSLMNYIPNGDFNDTTVLDNVGSTDGSKVVLSAARDRVGLPIVANVLKYSIATGNIFNIRTQIPNDVEDITFSFYMRSDSPQTNISINLKMMSRNNTTFKMLNVTSEWKRYSMYHKHKTGTLEITGYLESANYVNVYVSGLLLENNVRPSMYFNGKAITIQDKNTPNTYYAYNVSIISSYPSTSMDLETLMSYRADNSPLIGNEIGDDFTDTVAIKLDGKLTYIFVPVASPLDVHNMSLTFWFKLREMKACTVVKSDVLSLTYSDKNMRLIAPGIDHVFSSIDFNVNKWYYVSLVFTSDKVRLYVYNYYEEISIPTETIMTDNLYMGLGMSGDIGNFTLWNKSLIARDISTLSLTNKDVIIAAAQTTKTELVTSGLEIKPLQLTINNISGLGNCTYNARVNWTYPRLPQDYINLGYTVVKYEYYLEYYVPNGLITNDQIETHIATKALSKRVTNIKITHIGTNEYIDLINLPYNNNYRLSVRYVLSNAEMSDWSRCDLFWSKIIDTFQLSGSIIVCTDETKLIDIQQKVIDETKQNNLISYFKDKISKF